MLKGYEVEEVHYSDTKSIEELRMETFGDVKHYKVVMKNGFDGYKCRIMKEEKGTKDIDSEYLGFIEKTNNLVIVTKLKKEKVA